MNGTVHKILGPTIQALHRTADGDHKGSVTHYSVRKYLSVTGRRGDTVVSLCVVF